MMCMTEGVVSYLWVFAFFYHVIMKCDCTLNNGKSSVLSVHDNFVGNKGAISLLTGLSIC